MKRPPAPPLRLRADVPLIRAAGLDLPVPQRWSLLPIKEEPCRRCTRAGIPVKMTAGPHCQPSAAIRARWLQA